ncbi:hypothetical protein PGH45_18960 [Legionella pneumophila]|nr:hypothetical protein [Legionella pneumophila]
MSVFNQLGLYAVLGALILWLFLRLLKTVYKKRQIEQLKESHNLL